MSTDLAAEADFTDMAPRDVGVHITRLKTDDYTTNETLSRHIENMAEAAARIQPDTKPDVISYSCTSAHLSMPLNASSFQRCTLQYLVSVHSPLLSFNKNSDWTRFCGLV